MTDQTKNRALNAFSAVGHIPDGYVTAAEDALYEAETGLRRPQKPEGKFRRFMGSGWVAAVLSGIVALTVLILIIRAGQNPPTGLPPKQPAGSTIEMSDETVNFTIATEQESYPEGTNRFTVILTGKVPGQSITMNNSWHLEWIADPTLDGGGYKEVEISFTEEVAISAKPDKGSYATLRKSIFGTNTGGGFAPGTYRLHATIFNGEKYVSVAYCTFTVGASESAENAQDFTLSPRSPLYPVGTEYISVIISGRNPQASYETVDIWYLEKLTAEGPVKINTPIENTAFEVAADDTTRKVCLSVGALSRLDAGLYRIHAMKQEEGELISLADCTFTVSEEAGRVLDRFEFHNVDPAPPYTIEVADVPYGADSLTVTITATRPDVSPADLPCHWFIDKTFAPWPFDDQMHPWTAYEPVLIGATEEGYPRYSVTIAFHYPPEWTEGIYYLCALTEPFGEYNMVLGRTNFSAGYSRVREQYLSPDELPYTVSLYENGKFTLTISRVSSFIREGRFEKRGSLLYLISDDPLTPHIWVFERMGDRLKYNAGLSSAPETTFPDGHMFYRDLEFSIPDESDELILSDTADYGIQPEREVYPTGANRISILARGKTLFACIPQNTDWVLEKLTASGYQPLEIEFEPGEDKMAVSDGVDMAWFYKEIRIPDALEAGTYRLHMVEENGSTRTSLTHCTFTVGEATPDVWKFYVSDGEPSGDNALPPMLTLWDDGSFHLRFGETDDHAKSGRYEERNGVLTLYAADGSVWVFEPENNRTGWIFRAERSSAYAAALLSDDCKFGRTIHKTLGVAGKNLGVAGDIKESYVTAEYLTEFARPGSLALLGNGEFCLDLMDYLSSNFHINPYGTYKEEGGRLYLDSESDETHMVFERTEGHLRLLTEESSGPCLSKFKENCLFYNMSLLTGGPDQP